MGTLRRRDPRGNVANHVNARLQHSVAGHPDCSNCNLSSAGRRRLRPSSGSATRRSGRRSGWRGCGTRSCRRAPRRSTGRPSCWPRSTSAAAAIGAARARLAGPSPRPPRSCRHAPCRVAGPASAKLPSCALPALPPRRRRLAPCRHRLRGRCRRLPLVCGLPIQPQRQLPSRVVLSSPP